MGTRVERYCPNCEEWEKGIDEINAMILFCYEYFLSPKYTSPKFKYCPWCSSELEYREGLVPSLDKLVEKGTVLMVNSKVTINEEDQEEFDLQHVLGG